MSNTDGCSTSAFEGILATCVVVPSGMITLKSRVIDSSEVPGLRCTRSAETDGTCGHLVLRIMLASEGTSAYM